jgi:hypothetical protein
MPTSDTDRYAQLLQNLAVRIGAIREAIERGGGVELMESDKSETSGHEGPISRTTAENRLA